MSCDDETLDTRARMHAHIIARGSIVAALISKGDAWTTEHDGLRKHLDALMDNVIDPEDS